MTKIGTVEILRHRIYPLDAESRDELRTTVVVEPGIYDVYGDGLSTFWLMRGHVNPRSIRRMGDGLFMMQPSDQSSDVEVQFPSQVFGPDEFADLLAGPECAEG